MEKLLSIIVPVYNVERYLSDCLRSILNQRAEQVEILLVDDGSSDGSGALCDECAQNHANVQAFHKPNGGLSDARNYGFSRATGEYVLFLDSDDFLSEDALEIICAELESEKPQMITWNAGIVEESGKASMRDARYYQHLGLFHRQRYTGIELIDTELRHHNDYATVVWLSAYRRDFLMSHDLWFQKGLLHEDELWTQKVLLNCEDILYINRILYFYRKRENSIMAQINRDCSKNLESFIQIHADLIEYCNHQILDQQFLKRFKGNLARRYLHAVAKYGPFSKRETLKKVGGRYILQDARGLRDKARAIILNLDICLYCKLSNWIQRG